MDRLISLQAAIDVVTKHYRAFDNDLLKLIVYEMKRLPSAQPEHFADVSNMDDGELDFVQKHEKIPVELMVSSQPKPCEDAVSRQTLQKELALYPIDDVTSEDEAGYNRAINDVQKMVLHLPSAQPEIIRCRDCKYWREHKYAKETKRYILFCGFNAIYTKADDFCSRAERRIDE